MSGVGSNAGVHNHVFITPGVLVSELRGFMGSEGAWPVFHALSVIFSIYIAGLYSCPDGDQSCQAFSELLSWMNPVLSGGRGNKETS